MRAATFLMFEGEASAALDLYARAFAGFRLGEIARYGPEGPGPEGSIMVGHATLGDHRLMVSDSFVAHDFGFTPAVSLFVTLDAAAQDRAAEVLAEGGTVLMPLGDHGFSPRFCWLADRFGVTWQLDLLRDGRA